MSTVALQEACQWHDELMEAEFQGRRDKESAIRSRLSEKTGVPESYLYRLAYKRGTMRDIAGEVYRLLNLAHTKYVRVCERIEASSDAMQAKRQQLESKRNAAVQGPHRVGVGTNAPVARATEE
jgi:hypothetical protein